MKSTHRKPSTKKLTFQENKERMIQDHPYLFSNGKLFGFSLPRQFQTAPLPSDEVQQIIINTVNDTDMSFEKFEQMMWCGWDVLFIVDIANHLKQIGGGETETNTWQEIRGAAQFLIEADQQTPIEADEEKKNEKVCVNLVNDDDTDMNEDKSDDNDDKVRINLVNDDDEECINLSRNPLDRYPLSV